MMKLGKLEPLYRYLSDHLADDGREKGHGIDPVATILCGANDLVRAGIAKNTSQPGMISLVTSDAIESQIAKELQQKVNTPTNFHPAFYADGKTMHISIAEVGEGFSRTCLSMYINESDNVVVDYVDCDTITNPHGLHGREIYSSIATVVEGDDGAKRRGFIRVVSKFYLSSLRETMAFRVNFKTTRAAPFYVGIYGLDGASVTGNIGPDAKALYEKLESMWTV